MKFHWFAVRVPEVTVLPGTSCWVLLAYRFHKANFCGPVSPPVGTHQ